MIFLQTNIHLKNPEEIKGIINEYYPNLIDKLSENTIEMLDFSV